MIMLSALFNFCIGFCLLLGFVYIELGHIPITTLLIPVILAPYVLMLLGLSWILAALGVYIRDIQQVSGTFSTLLLFLSPIFILITTLPATLQKLILINPIAVIVEASRSAVIYGEHPDYAILVTYSVLALMVAVVGVYFFSTNAQRFRGCALINDPG